MIPSVCPEYQKGLRFCPDACVRTITILAGNSAFFDGINMIIKDESGRQIQIEKDVRGHPGPEPVGNRFFSAYAVALPKGNFKIRFENSSDSLAWPKYAFIVPEAAPVSCSNYVEESDLKFVKPEPSRPTCDDLIYNGNFDLGKDGWYAFHFNIELQETGGIDGTAALASSMALNTGNNLAQSIDGSCLEVDNEFDVSLSFKIIDYDGTNNHDLPYVRLESQNYLTSDPPNKSLLTIGATVFRTSSEIIPGGWNMISGVWTIDENTANAAKHIFHVGGGNHKVIIDNVVIQRNLRPSSAPTGEPSLQPSLRSSIVLSSLPASAAPSEIPTVASSLAPSSESISVRRRLH